MGLRAALLRRARAQAEDLNRALQDAQMASEARDAELVAASLRAEEAATAEAGALPGGDD